MKKLPFTLVQVFLIFALSFAVPLSGMALSACNDEIDNDGDGLTDVLDPGCLSPAGNTELNSPVACMPISLWQLGKFDLAVDATSEFPANDQYSPTFEYPIVNWGSDAPALPSCLSYTNWSSVATNTRNIDCTKQLNLNFDLARPVTNGVLVLSRLGSETNTLLVDGMEIGTSAVSESVIGVFKFPLPLLTKGSHTVSLRYDGGGSNNGNGIDAIAYIGCQQKPACSDGLDNDGDGLADALDPACDNPTVADEAESSPPGAQAEIAWQLGSFDIIENPMSSHPAAEFPYNDNFSADFNYAIEGTLTRFAQIPAYLATQRISEILDSEGNHIVADGRPLTDSTARLILHFTLKKALSNAMLVFSRAGAETDSVRIDGGLPATTVGKEAKLQAFRLPAGELAAGKHTVSISYEGGGPNNGNYIDAIAMVGYAQNPVITSSCGTTPDRCGVCGGNGQSCLGCQESNLIPLLTQISNATLLQRDLAQAALREVVRSAPAKSAALYWARTQLRRLDSRYSPNQLLVPIFPTTVRNCSNANFCSLVSLSGEASTFASNTSSLTAVVRESARRARKFPKFKRGLFSKFLKDSDEVSKRAQDLVAKLPRSSSICS